MSMKGKIYALRRPLSSFQKLIPHFLSLLLVFSFTQVSAKTVIIGNGSGTVTQQDMTGLAPGDVLAINPGTYSGGSFSNLTGITITNNGGTVIFTGTLYVATLNGCTISNLNFQNVSGIGIRWNGNSKWCLEQNMTFTNVSGSANDAAENSPYNGDTSTLKLYHVTMDNLKLFRCGPLFQGAYGGANAMLGYIDYLSLTNITIDSTLTNGTEVSGVLFHCNFHDWKVNYKGTITLLGDVGLIQMNGNGSFYNIYRNGGRGYIMRIWNLGLKTVGTTYFYNNVDLNTNCYGTIDTRVDPAQFCQYTTGGNCYVWNNTSGNKGDLIKYWSSLAVIGNFPAPYVCEVKNNISYNLVTNGKPKICMDQSNGTWVADSSNNLYFASNVGVVDPNTAIPYAGSPVLGKGATIPMVTTDIYGTPRTGAYDIGAVQHTGTAIPPPPNQPPVANAGPNQTITLPTNTVPLDGTKSKDPDGTISTYAWTQSSGPSTSTITNGNTASAVTAGLIAGTYIFKLVVTDNDNATGTAYDTIVVNPSGNKPPVANAGADVTITLPINSVSLNGSASTDPDGTISTYNWTQNSGPSTATITNAATATATATNLIQGTYVFKLTVTDNGGASATDTIIVKVNTAANQPPLANAGADQTITLPTNTANLNGSASKDPDGTIAAYNWTQSAGPSTATIGNATAATTSVSGLVQGTYVFRLTVTDNLGATGTDSIIVKVNAAANQPPVANAGSDQTITLPVNTGNLNGSASTDPDGTIASYSWTQSSGPSAATIGNATAASTTATNLIQGTYVFRLIVTDNLGATGTDSVIIHVNAAANQPPIANAGTSQTITLPVNTATLDGTGSSDPDGTIATYAWTQVSGPSASALTNGNTATATAANLVVGQYIFQLAVTDNSGATTTAQVKVTVITSGAQPPIANAGADQTITLPTNSVNVNGGASQAPSGSITGYSWTQSSGPNSANIANANSVSTAITGLVQGTYVFKLTVTDNNNATGTDSIIVKVNAAANQPPVANAGAGKTIQLPTNSTTLDGSASSDPDGSIASYSWTQVSGPSAATLTNANAATASVSNMIAGQYVFQLTVTDNQGATGTAQVKINEIAAANQPPIANAGASMSITLPLNSVTLDGSASTDPDGTIVSYIWTQVSGPASAAITNGNTVTATAGSLVAGLYVFQLTVTDNNGATSTALVKITVAPAPNQPPVANAGASQSIQLPVNDVNLNGSASSDPDGTITSYSWAQISGPSTAAITNGSTATPNMGGLIAGQYVFELTVTDNNGASAKAQVKITVIAAINQSPIANAGSDQSITLPTNSVALNGSGSYDPDGTIVSYSWVKTAGSAVTITNANTVNPTISSMVAGQYTFQLTVTDNNGATAKDVVTITVNPAPGQTNQAPIANAGTNQTINLPDNSTKLDGTNSFDPDGTITSYYWSQISGPSTAVITSGNTTTPTVSSLVLGQYVFELTVTDNDGASGKDHVTITVNNALTNQPSLPPVANAGKDTTITLPANAVTLNGSGSLAPDGSITTYQWQEVSGPNSATFSSFTSSVSTAGDLVVGDYVFQLTITDNTGATSTATVKVKVVDNLRSLEQISLYPNPAHDVVHLRLISDSTGTVRVNLYDMNGRLVHAEEMSKPASFMDNTLNIGRLAGGMYTIQAIIGNNKVLVTKLIKQ
ncbi:MAG: hypothetical protein C5B59_11015 [Bacteroidetes bacterium]|nr:MAG: hypothetical protein C5B59_11015 [Bacteroidota bacterium]